MWRNLGNLAQSLVAPDDDDDSYTNEDYTSQEGEDGWGDDDGFVDEDDHFATDVVEPYPVATTDGEPIIEEPDVIVEEGEENGWGDDEDFEATGDDDFATDVVAPSPVVTTHAPMPTQNATTEAATAEDDGGGGEGWGNGSFDMDFSSNNHEQETVGLSSTTVAPPASSPPETTTTIESPSHPIMEESTTPMESTNADEAWGDDDDALDFSSSKPVDDPIVLTKPQPDSTEEPNRFIAQSSPGGVDFPVDDTVTEQVSTGDNCIIPDEPLEHDGAAEDALANGWGDSNDDFDFDHSNSHHTTTTANGQIDVKPTMNGTSKEIKHMAVEETVNNTGHLTKQEFDTTFDELSHRAVECKELRSEITSLQNELERTQKAAEAALEEVKAQHERENNTLSSQLRQVLSEQENVSQQLTETQRTLLSTASELQIFKDRDSNSNDANDPKPVIVLTEQQHERDLQTQYQLLDAKSQRIRELEQHCRNLELQQETVVLQALQQQQAVTQQSETLASELLSVAKERDVLQVALHETRGVIDEMQRQVEASASNHNDTNAQVEALQAENTALQQQIKDVQFESATLTADWKAAKAENATLLADRDTQGEAMEAEWTAKFDAAKEESQSVVMAWQKEYEAERADKTEMEHQLRAEIAGLQAELDEEKENAADQLRALATKLDEKTAAYDTLEANVEALRAENSDLQARVADSSPAPVEQPRSVEIVDRSLAAAVAAAAVVPDNTEVAHLQNENQRLSENLRQAREFLQSSGLEMERALGEQEQIHAQALEALQNEKDVEIQRLREERAGDDDGWEESGNEVENPALNSELEGLRQQLSTLAASLQDAQNHGSDQEAEIARLTRETEKLQQQLTATLDAEANDRSLEEKRQEENRLLENQINNLRQEIASNQAMVEQTQNDKALASAEVSRLASELAAVQAQTNEEIMRSNTAQQELQEQVFSLQSEVTERQRDLEEAHFKIQELEVGLPREVVDETRPDEVNQVKTELNQAKNCISELEGNLANMRLEFAQRDTLANQFAEESAQTISMNEGEISRLKEALSAMQAQRNEQLDTVRQDGMVVQNELQERVEQQKNQLEQLQEELGAVSSKLEEAQEASDDIQLEKDLLEDDLNELRSENADLVDKLSQAESSLAETSKATAKVAELENELSRFGAEMARNQAAQAHAVEEAQRELTASQSEANKLQTAVSTLQSEAEQMQQELISAKSALDEAEQHRISDIENIQLEKDLLDGDLNEMSKENSALGDKVARLEKELAAKSNEGSSVEALQAELSRLTAELTQYQGDREQILALQQRVQELTTLEDQLTSELDATKKAVQSFDEERRRKMEEITRLQQECDSLRADSSPDGAIEDLQLDLDLLRDEIHEVKSENSELKVAAKSADMEARQQQEEITRLQQECVNLRANPSAEGELEDLQLDLDLLRDENDELKSDNLEVHQQLKRMDELKSENSELNELVKDLAEKNKSLEFAAKSADEETRRKEEALTSLQNECTDLRANSTPSGAMEDLQLDLDLLRDEMDELKSENSELRQQVDDLSKVQSESRSQPSPAEHKEELAHSQRELVALNTENAALRSKLQGIEAQIASSGVEELKAAYSALKANYDDMSTDLMSKEMELEELQEQIQTGYGSAHGDSNAEIESLRGSLERANHEIASMKAATHENTARLQELLLEKPIFEDTISSLQDALSMKEKKLAELSAKIEQSSLPNTVNESGSNSPENYGIIEALKRDLAAAKEERDETERHRFEAVNHIATLEKTMDAKALENRTIQAEVDLLEGQCIELQSRVETLSKESSACTQNDSFGDLAKQHEVLSAKMENLQQLNDSLEKEVVRYRELEAYTSTQLEMVEAAAQEEAANLRSQISRWQLECEDLTATLNGTPKHDDYNSRSHELEMQAEIERLQEREAYYAKETQSLQEQVAWSQYEKGNETEVFARRIRELETDLLNAQEQLAVINRQKAELEKSQSRDQSANESAVSSEIVEQCRVRMDQLEAETAELRQACSELNAAAEERNKLREELQAERLRFEAASAELNMAQADNEELLVQFGLIKQHIDASQEYIGCLHKELESAGRTDILESAASSAWEKASEAIVQTHEMDGHDPSHGPPQSSDDVSLSQFAQRIGELEEELRAKSATVKQLNEAVAKLEAGVQSVNEMKENLDVKQGEIATLSEEVANLQEELVREKERHSALLSSQDAQTAVQTQQELELLREHLVAVSVALEKAENGRADSINRLVLERETHAKNLRMMTDNVKRFYSTVTAYGDA